MSLNRASTIFLGALTAATVVAALSAAAPDTRPPRIVSSVMQDTDGDARADRLRVTYSEQVRHRLDRDGKYPFAVTGYKIRAVGSASRNTLTLLLVEKAAADRSARPAVVYRPTKAGPVKDGGSNQAVAQVFRGTRALGAGDVGTPPPPPPPPPETDRDHDGTPNEQDCAPDNAAIHPGAPDLPDLAFVDSNCDGIDGTEKDAIFASQDGKDTNPGTKAAPLREINTAVAAAAGKGKYVIASFGVYERVEAKSNVGIYGFYDPKDWSRKANPVIPKTDPGTYILGEPEGLLADKATGVVLQLLRITGSSNRLKLPSGMTFYGVRVINGSSVKLQRVSVYARSGTAGADGINGANGASGQAGGDGGKGSCDGSTRGTAGAGGASPFGRPGGDGGGGGGDTGGSAGTGRNGIDGTAGSAGGTGGRAGDPGHDGTAGASGSTGSDGVNGRGGNISLPGNDDFAGQAGTDGTDATPGNGGGGGGGGGGQVCTFCNNGSGNGGGGGGAGGGAGTGGMGGGPGGGSFGLYVTASTVAVSDGSSIKAENGGAGGKGGNGGLQGPGGIPGAGSRYCKSEIGEGGDGGPGGSGGHGGGGGGGSGGPSMAIFKAASNGTTVGADTKLAFGTPGAGGTGGLGTNSTRNDGETGLGRTIYG